MSESCPLCGQVHEPVVVDDNPLLFFAGVEIRTCPQVPPDCFYEDREFEKGPRGVLHRLEEGER